jgi:hypothetical protein
VKGVVQPDAELKNLENITSKVTLEIIGAEYDRKTELVTVEVRLRNTSKNNLRAPFKARVIGLKSDIGGQVRLVGQPNIRSVGSIVQFDSPNKLQPGAATDVMRLAFHLKNTRSPGQGRDVKLGVLNLDLLVFSHVENLP